MVLSNKKLKQKLRAAKAELIAAAETQNNTSNKDEGLRATHLLNLLDAQRPRLSKREKRRQKPENNGEVKKQKQSASGSVDKTEAELKSADVKLQEKKRKRDESEPLEKEKEKTPERLKKKKKIKNIWKPKEKAEIGQVRQEMQDQNGTEASHEKLDAKARPSNDRKEPEQSTKVYVGGIPYYSTGDDIRSYFESCGTITDIDCMTFPDTGKFRGIAIITFKTEAATKRALALDGSDMGGLYLKIQPFKSERVNKLPNFSLTVVEGYNRIYVGNLPWDVTEDDLGELFSDCTISSIRFGEDKETGEFKGYAHVDFADGLSLNMALKLDQSVLCGRNVRISCAVPKKGIVTKQKSMPKNNHGGEDKATVVSKIEENSSVKVTMDGKDQESSAILAMSSKIRSRTCYECGEKGHVLSSCPKNQTADVTKLTSMPKNNHRCDGAVTAASKVEENRVTVVAKDGADSKYQETNSGAMAVSSKIRRRTCYECGEKGHLSSSCPKNQAADVTMLTPMPKINHFGEGEVTKVSKVEENSTIQVTVVAKEHENSSVKVSADSEYQETNSGAMAVSSKIRRRTCYECGEKGHLSSSCPKNQTADLANTGAV